MRNRRDPWILLLGLCLGGGGSPARAASGADPWQRVPAILQRVAPPTFPARTLKLTDFGAVGDGASDCTEAFRRAIQACHEAGGGRVIVPPGRYLTGAIHLKSNVDLHVSEGATLLFSQNPERYLPPVRTRYEGNDCYNYSPLIYAFEQTNVAITGGGTIDGQGNVHVWKEMDRHPEDQDRLRAMAERGVPVEQRVFGAGHMLRPNLIQFYGCTGVLVEGVTVKNGPMWTIHPVLCRNVTLRGLNVQSLVPNGDGIDPESCRDVLIRDCQFATRDDAIALKSGRNADGRRVNVPCEDVVIQRCVIRGTPDAVRNGLAIGSEISAGVRNVFVEDCSVADRHRGISLKTNTLRGGFIEDVYFRNLRFRNLEDAVLLIDTAFGSERGPYSPRVRRVELRHVTADGADQLWEIDAPDPAAVADISFVDCVFTHMKDASAPRYVSRMSFVRSTSEGRLLTTPASPLFPSRPGPLALLAAGLAACGAGALAARWSRRFSLLLLLALWTAVALLLQLEPSLPGLAGQAIPVVENARVGIAWSAGCMVAAALTALVMIRLSPRKGRRQVSDAPTGSITQTKG